MAARDNDLMLITEISRESIKSHIDVTTDPKVNCFDFKKAFEQMKKLRIEEIERYRENMAKEILVDIFLIFSDPSTSRCHILDKRVSTEKHPIDGFTNDVWIQQYLIAKLGDAFFVTIEDPTPIIRGCPIEGEKKLVIKRNNI